MTLCEGKKCIKLADTSFWEGAREAEGVKRPISVIDVIYGSPDKTTAAAAPAEKKRIIPKRL